jgi:cytoskeletal protein RodZ
MADDTRRAYAQSARGEPYAGWGEPTLGGGEQRESVGERLRRERETYGLHLREVSESLRIRYAYLDAIERSAFDELPGPTYAVGFVRGYAQFLGLDDDRIVQRFKEESQGLKRDQELHFPEPVNEGKIPGGTILILSVVLVALAYGGWVYLSDSERSFADLVPEVPESLQRMVGATEEPPVPEATDLSRSRTAEPATREGGLESEQVAELPETAPDPDAKRQGSGGDAAAAPGDDSPASTGGADGAGTGDGPPEVPQNAAGGAATGQNASAPTAAEPGAPNDTGATGSGADAAPDVPGAGTETAASGTGAASGTDTGTGDDPSIPDAPQNTGQSADTQPGDTQTADTQPAADDRAANEPTAADRSGAGESASDAAAAETGGNPAPPEVPEMQQDDSGIPTAPERTQTASTGAAGDGPDGRTFGASPANSRVTLVATARSWVQVRGPDDSLVLTRLLRPGDRYNVPDRPGLTLHTGNAGGLQVMVDGREIGSLGGDGEVRREVLLEPDALTAGG